VGSIAALGDDAVMTPVQISLPDREPWNSDSTIVSICAGGDGTTVLVLADGNWCSMGYNSFGSVGQGVQVVDGSTRTEKKQALEIDCCEDNVASVVAGRRHTLFLKTDGTAWATGSNGFGQMGTMTEMSESRETGVIWAPYGVASAAAGVYHSVLVMDDGTARVMGWNNYGQQGLGNIGGNNAVGGDGNRNTPTAIPRVTGVIAADAEQHTILLKNDGTILVFGSNRQGQLGLGGTGKEYSPVELDTTTFGTKVAGITVTYEFSAILLPA
jgi:alpha-tubulin suppressor-like RCC1 family protein